MSVICVSKIGFIGDFFFVLCLHFWYYIIWKSCNVSPRFVRISVFSHSFDVSYKSFHIKKIFRLYVMRNHTIFIRKESVTIYWYLPKLIHTTFDSNLVNKQKKNFTKKSNVRNLKVISLWYQKFSTIKHHHTSFL